MRIATERAEQDGEATSREVRRLVPRNFRIIAFEPVLHLTPLDIIPMPAQSSKSRQNVRTEPTPEACCPVSVRAPRRDELTEQDLAALVTERLPVMPAISRFSRR